ncbi:MAG: ammonium transporter [Burkholderiaceae bacterium]
MRSSFLRFARIALGLAGLTVSSFALAAGNAASTTAEVTLTPIQTLLIMLCAALVFFMQAGFALLESGLSRAKNAINVLMKNYLDMCFGAIAFFVIGYGLMYGANPSGWFGTSGFLPHGASLSTYTNVLYAMMFAATAATIVSGAIAERTHFRAYIWGSVVITAIIYPIFGSWVWGPGGWLAKMGFVDFAGSTVVHAVGGWCALAALIVVKPRLGRFAPNGEVRDIPGHNLSAAALGALILWLGWFGFNGGSAVSAGLPIETIGKIALNTHLGGAAGALGALLAMRLFGSHTLLTVTLNGSVAGLVAITAGCHVMEPMFAIITGLVAGFLTSVAEAFLLQMRLDDVVGAVAVHLVGGIWGTLAVGLFTHGRYFDLQLITAQLTGIAAAGLWAFPLAYIMYKALDAVIGLRATAQQEQRGLDFSEHYEVGYPEFQRDIVHRGRES